MILPRFYGHGITWCNTQTIDQRPDYFCFFLLAGGIMKKNDPPSSAMRKVSARQQSMCKDLAYHDSPHTF